MPWQTYANITIKNHRQFNNLHPLIFHFLAKVCLPASSFNSKEFASNIFCTVADQYWFWIDFGYFVFKKMLAAHTNSIFKICPSSQNVWKLLWNIHHYNSSKHPKTSWRHPSSTGSLHLDCLTILTELCIWGRAFPTFLQTSPFIILWSLSRNTRFFFWPKQVLCHPKTCSMKLQWPIVGTNGGVNGGLHNPETAFPNDLQLCLSLQFMNSY